MKSVLRNMNIFSGVDRRIYIWVAIIGVIMIVLTVGSLAVGQAKQDDFNGKKILHSACLIEEKEFNPNTSRSGVDYTTFKVKTNCGDFMTTFEVFDFLIKDETYDLTATVGNWANEPSLISAQPYS